MAVLTLDEVKRNLKLEYEDEDDDAFIESLIAQAQEHAENYTRKTFDEFDCPATVKAACMIYVSHYYEYRDGNDHVAYRTMREAFENLLYPNRDESLMF